MLGVTAGVVAIVTLSEPELTPAERKLIIESAPWRAGFRPGAIVVHVIQPDGSVQPRVLAASLEDLKAGRFNENLVGLTPVEGGK